MNIVDYLYQTYGRQVRPGKKTICPFCYKKGFSVKKDLTVGKCFRCNHYIVQRKSGLFDSYQA